MKKVSFLLSILCGMFWLFSGLSISGCKKTYPTIYRDTTIYKDSTIYKDTTIRNYGDTNTNKQILIKIGDVGYATSPTVNYFFNNTVPGFNIDDYPGVDSAIVTCAGYIYSGTGSLYTQLYDVTDAQPVAGSTVTTTNVPPPSFSNAWQVSGNFLSSLPHKPVDLAFDCYASDAHTTGQIQEMYLVLFRK